MVDLMRSLLYVPGNQRDKVRKAASYGADVVQLDLEDSVPPEEKAAARATVEEALAAGDLAGARVAVRINGLSTLESSLDLKAMVRPGVWALRIPKVETSGEIRELDAVVADLERHADLEVGALKLLPALETPFGVLRALEIATASPRIIALAFGGEDLVIALGVERSREGLELQHARGQVALVAAAVGIPALDTVYTRYQDEEGLVEETRRARQMGFSGKSLIHPGQIAPVHRVFAPTPEEVQRARRIVEAYEQGVAGGAGAVALQGQMVDRPVVARALRTLALAEAAGPQVEEGRL